MSEDVRNNVESSFMLWLMSFRGWNFALDAAGGIRLTLIGDMHWSARDIISL